MVNLNYVYENIYDFYEAAIIPTAEGNREDVLNHLNNDKEKFRGLSLNKIKNAKYGYTEGLSDLKQLELNIPLGGSSKTYRYDEFDGDDLNYDRLLDGFPALRKRIKTHGIGSGRLINVYVIISENCIVGYDEMLHKAHTAIRIIDLLENIGYRVAVYACDYTRDKYGTYKGENDVEYKVTVCIKKHQDTLNKALILNCISPWFFRYWIFSHQKGHYKNGWGMGHSIKADIPETKENIVINNGECLNEKTAKQKIKKIKKLFDINE